MLPLFFRTIRRQLWKNKLYSVINIAGLTASVVCLLFAVLFWNDEKDFDRFHQHHQNIYRVTTTMKDQKTRQPVTSSGTGQVQAPAFAKDIPEISQAVRLLGGQIKTDIAGGQNAISAATLFADKNFFEIFSFTSLQGDPHHALDNLNNAVITETTARKLFNSTDVVGKTLTLDADPSAERLGKPMLITAVVKDPPANSSIQFDILLPFAFLQLSFEDNTWQNSYLGTYLLLHPDASQQQVIKKLQNVYQQYGNKERIESITNDKFDPEVSYGLQPFTDIHLGTLGKIETSSESGVVNETRPMYSWLFMGIAVFILLMSCINFINISIAASIKRAKEVGVRKITGGTRVQIISQFLGESSVLCFIAFMLAASVIQILLPWFNNLTGKSIPAANLLNPGGLTMLAIFFVLTILLSGMYPAIALSRFSPVEVLYNRIRLSGKNIFGKGLVVFQVSVGAFLIIATVIYYQQMDFIQNKDLGYDDDFVLVSTIKGDRPLAPLSRQLRQAVNRAPSLGLISFGGGQQIYPVVTAMQQIDAVHQVIDENYLKLLKIQLLAGRNIDPALYPSDSSSAVIVNEAFVRSMGIEHPLGAQIRTDKYFDSHPKTIVGIVKDFHAGSLKQTIKPAVMFMSNWYGGGMYIKLNPQNVEAGLRTFESIYKQILPGAVYSYSFLDELTRQQYLEDDRWKKIITVAAAISILICCMGLFGLAHLATGQRTREVGIRKVLGANIRQLVLLQSAGFIKLVGLAFLVAMPAAWLAMSNWLEHFAYRISIGGFVLFITGIILTAMAAITVGIQSYYAATANPVDAIRS